MALDKKNPLVKAMESFKKSLQPSKKRTKTIEAEVVRFETLGEQILAGEVKYLSDGNFDLCVRGNMERVANYAKYEPDNKTKFKRFNIECEIKGITGVAFLEEFDNMISRIERTCGTNPEQAKGYIAKMCAEYAKFCETFEQIKKLVLSQNHFIITDDTAQIIKEQLERITATKQAIDQKYALYITQMQPAHKTLCVETKSYYARDDQAKQVQAEMEAARNAALKK
ncbi:MAG: hypothetical protein IJE91_02020 [Clostridia bacterium]|nr:hypothetical protein [Clostridia bacterium]